jgi:hypothetical protein
MAVEVAQYLFAGVVRLAFGRELEFGSYQIGSAPVTAVPVGSRYDPRDPPGAQFPIPRTEQSTARLQWVGYLTKLLKLRSCAFEKLGHPSVANIAHRFFSTRSSRRVHKWTRLDHFERAGRGPPLVREVNSRTSPHLRPSPWLGFC